tara:strand:+ start:795 stop:1394 length:600 start_codon:yes stop_codon:yes gene_type:complete
MSSNFGYIDVVLLALFAGFILLRLRNILGRRTGHEIKPNDQRKSKAFSDLYEDSNDKKNLANAMDDKAKKEFLAGAKIAYERIITSFATGDKKSLKGLLDKEMYSQFSEAIDERNAKEFKSETTFIGVKSANIDNFIKEDNIYNITVNFVSEIITCIKDKKNNIIEGNPDTIKTVKDNWKFSKNMWSQDPTWYLVDTSK